MKNTFVKRILVILVLLLALCGCGGGSKNTSSDNSTNNSSESIEARTAIIFKILDGTGVSVIRDSDTEEAYEGMRLSAQDEIVTDEVSSVYLRIDDDKNVLLNTSSKIVVSELSSGKLSIKLEYGDFFFNVENKLADDESMEFSIGSTSMSIRGTSGAGKLVNGGDAAFSIYTGLGEISDTLQEGISYELIPNTIVKFDVERETKSSYQTAVLSTVTEDDISSLVSTYISENDNYASELEDNGWKADEEKGLAPDQKAISDQIAKNDTSGDWKQNSDGSFINVKVTEENKQKETETNLTTVKKEEPKKEETKQETVTPQKSIISIAKPVISDTLVFDYNGQERTIVTGIDTTTMSVSNINNISGTNAKKYSFTITPKDGYQWNDHTVTPISVNWEIKAVDLELTGTNYVKGAIVDYSEGVNTFELDYVATYVCNAVKDDNLCGENDLKRSIFESDMTKIQIKQIATTSSSLANNSEDESYIASNKFVLVGDGTEVNYNLVHSFPDTVIIHIKPTNGVYANQ